ncbi:MAG: C1 family peptidase [Anaerolineae bacterium]
MPSRFDWRDYYTFPPIRNQQACGGCWAFAAMGAMEGTYLVETGVGIDLSEQDLISGCYSSASCTGQNASAAEQRHMFDHIKNNGVVDDSCLPFQSGRCSNEEPDPPFCYAPGDPCNCGSGQCSIPCSCNRCEGWQSRRWLLANYGHVGSDREAIKRALVCHGPLRACGGGHCIVIVGWDANGWIIRNSWGNDWPEAGPTVGTGYGTVAYDDPWCRDAWYVSGISRGFILNYEENDGLAAGDVQADGFAEIILGDRSDDRIRIYTQSGGVVASWSRDYEESDDLAAGDVNGDYRAEIIHGDASDDRIHIFDRNGNEIASFDVDYEQYDDLAVGDVNSDGRAEIILGDASADRIRIFDMSGNEIAGFGRDYERYDGLAAGDVNGDGKAEIIHGDRSDDYIRAFNMNGTLLASFTLDFEGHDGLTAGDVNGDGKAEIIHGDRDNWIRIFDMNGNLVREFAAEFEQGDGLVAGDVDHDGRAEIILGDRSDWMRIFHLGEGSGSAAGFSSVQLQSRPNALAEYLRRVLAPERSESLPTRGRSTTAQGPSYFMPNPAAVYCLALGYEYVTVQTEQGESGVCRLPGGDVGDWDFLLGFAGQPHSYCAQKGYELKVVHDPTVCERFRTTSCAVCVLPGGQEVEVTELMGLSLTESPCGDGVCSDPENSANCPQDCPAGGADGYCDGANDGICDPDCAPGGDPNCRFIYLPSLMRNYEDLP